MGIYRTTGNCGWAVRCFFLLFFGIYVEAFRVVYSDTPAGVPSAAGNVVTSLLLDPFSEDEPTTRAIQSRHAEVHAGGEFVIR